MLEMLSIVTPQFLFMISAYAHVLIQEVYLFGFQGATVILSGPSGPPVTTVPGQSSELV